LTYSRLVCVGLLLFALSLVGNIVPQVGIDSVEASPDGWHWYKAELHHHSTFSDGYRALPKVIDAAKNLGYSAFFLTDHDTFKELRTTNVIIFEDSATVPAVSKTWSRLEYTDGTVYNNTVEISTAQKYSGTSSMHFAVNCSGFTQTGYYLGAPWRFGYETDEWKNPSLFRGTIWLNFTVYPMNFGDFAGLRVTLHISDGTDTGITWDNATYRTTIEKAYFTWAFYYTTDKNITTSTNLMRTYNGIYNASGSTRIETLTANQWQSLSINVTKYIESLKFESATNHHSLASYGSAISGMKVCVRTNNKKLAQFYVDKITINQTPSTTFQSEMAYRNSHLNHWDTATFKTFPAVEFSPDGGHQNYFVWNFTDASKYIDRSTAPMSRNRYNIPPWAHNQGYLIQLNHPTSGGTNPTDVINNEGWGADTMETRSQDEISVWDSLLSKGVIIIGVGSSDLPTHLVGGEWATKIYASSLTLESLLKSIYEGRIFITENDFTGTPIFNIKTSTEPYPSRYINYIASSDNATLYLNINQGLRNGWKVCWVRNGTYFENTTVTGSSFTAFKSYSMPNNANYWRVEIRNASNNIVAMSEPIFFKKVTNLPPGIYAYAYNFKTSTGINYTNNVIKGITSVSYGSGKLTLTIDGLGTSTIEVYCGDEGRPYVAGATSWSYDESTKIATVDVLHTSLQTVTLAWGFVLDLRTTAITATFICVGLGLAFRVLRRRRK